MSIDQSLKKKSGRGSSRNVLTRAERIARLRELGEWDDDKQEQSPFGLPKVRVRKLVMKKVKKKKEAPEKEEKKKKKK